MADVSPPGDPDLYLHVNDSGAGSPAGGGYVHLYDDSSGQTFLSFRDDGTIERDAAITMHATTGTTIVEFATGPSGSPTIRGAFLYTSGDTRLSLMTAYSMGLQFSSTGNLAFRIASGTSLALLGSNGDWTFNDPSGNQNAKLQINASNDAKLSLGTNPVKRGYLLVKADTGSASPRAGVVALEAEDGTPVFLWLRKNGAAYDLMARITTDPQSDDATGTTIVAGIT